MLNTGCHSLEMVGFHSAPWRGSFGGSEYISNGSHGCVNLPTYAAATLYKLVSQGRPGCNILLNRNQRNENYYDRLDSSSAR